MTLAHKERYEIGSYFALSDTEIPRIEHKDIDWLPYNGDASYIFSGRAAIEYAIRDILNSKSINSVYMPSYCCDSMRYPFISHNIEIIYYDVHYNINEGITYEIDTSVKCDIFFAMSYFGVEEPGLDSEIQAFFEKGVIVIEDITHRLLYEAPYNTSVHYRIASLRKWFAIPTGGFIVKHNGRLFDKHYIDSDKKVIPKIEAMKEKFQYLQGVNLNKESYLGKFNEFEKSLCDMDSDYKIDSLSVAIIERLDIKEIRLKRQKNAKILYEGIKKFSSIKPLVPNPDLSRFCPLFVPVIVTNGKRNELHKHLIKHNIYCPIHWPKNWGADTGIEEIESSLICDQRYDDSDMRTILETIRVWDEMNV